MTPVKTAKTKFPKIVALTLLIVGLLSLFYVFYSLYNKVEKETKTMRETMRIKEALVRAKSIASEVSLAEPAASVTKKGVIVCAGGFRAIECFGGLSWMRELERRDPSLPKLPIEWFYAGDEMPQMMIDFLKPKLEPIKFVDCLKISKESSELLKGYPMKAFAPIHTSFESFILLDSDCIPLKHPGWVFENENFKTKGTMFWRDFKHRGNFGKLYNKHHQAFDNKLMISVDFLNMPENESGQFVVNRKMHLDVLKFVWGLNKMKDVFYKVVHGDKDLFALGFYLTDNFKYYYQVPLYPYTIRNTKSEHEAIGQRNPENPTEIVFVHRTHQKHNCLNKKIKYCIMPIDHYTTYSEEEPLKTRLIYYKYQGDHVIPENLKEMTKFVQTTENTAADKLNSLGLG